MVARWTAFSLADFLQQFDLDLLNFKKPIVLLSQEVIDFFMRTPITSLI